MMISFRDVVESYLFHDSIGEEGKQRKVIDHHLALGVSLGGHSVWQLMFADPRVRAGVAVIGCPDYMSELCFFILALLIGSK